MELGEPDDSISMKIELIGYPPCDDPKEERFFKASIMREVLSTSTSDIVVFPGSSILSLDDFTSIVNDITITINVKIVIFEVSSVKKTKIVKNAKSKKPIFIGRGYCYDFVQKKYLLYELKQRYAMGSDLDRYPELFDEMYEEWKGGLRSFKYDGKTFTVLMCGETAMLKCNMVNGKIGPAQFRIQDPQALANFQKIMDGTDIFLNPIHTIQGNQGKIKRRREVLSSKGKIYFSTASIKNGEVSSKSASLQYAVCNGNALPPISEEIRGVNNYEHISRMFKI